jgi:hypothetical protein
VRVDIFKYRKTRQYYFLEKIEVLQGPSAKSRGRPKGRKNGQKKAKPKIKKQRGKKGLDTVFSKGTRGMVKVNSYRNTLTCSKNKGGAVEDGLRAAFSLFAGKTIHQK